jgi:hypothetical protein
VAHRQTPTAKKRLLLLAALWLALLAAPALAKGAHRIGPMFGGGIGVFGSGDGADLGLQLDLGVGWEQQGEPLNLGGLVRLDPVLLIPDGNPPANVRFDLAPMATLSSTFKDYEPFFRAGLGPMFSASRNKGGGLGAHGEVVFGRKNGAEIGLDAKALIDGGGLSLGLLFVMRWSLPWAARAFTVD